MDEAPVEVVDVINCFCVRIYGNSYYMLCKLRLCIILPLFGQGVFLWWIFISGTDPMQSGGTELLSGEHLRHDE